MKKQSLRRRKVKKKKEERTSEASVRNQVGETHCDE